METSNLVSIFTTMVSQTGKAFGIVIKAEALFKNLQNKNKEFPNKVSQAKEVAKKAKADVEVLKKQKAEEFVKLISALVKIVDLKKEVHLSNNEMASLTK